MYLDHIKREQRLTNRISRWLFRGNILGDMSSHSPAVDAYALKNGPHPFPHTTFEERNTVPLMLAYYCQYIVL